MNSVDKLKELGRRVDLSDEEVTAVKRSKWRNKDTNVYILMSGVVLLGAALGYILGSKNHVFEVPYPYQTFLGPAMLTMEKKSALRSFGIVRIILFLTLISFLIGFKIGMGDSTDTVVYTPAIRYGVFKN